MKLSISVIILTYNEEIHIERLIKSIADWAGEIFIVDSFSTDKTLEIAKKYNCKIFQHKFENQAQQFNWALDNLEIKNEWILRLDADEYLTNELKDEITEKLKNISSDISGFYIKRRVYFMGRWVKHGSYYPTWILRLFRKNKARSEQREIDEHIILLEGKSGKLKNDFIDDNKKGLMDWITKHNNYSTREASAKMNYESGMMNNEGKLSGQTARKRWLKNNFYYKMPMFFRACWYFCYRYFFRLGFLDGKEGLIFHFLHAFWYRFLVDSKIYELKMKSTKKNF
ncbi:glycosyltransferase family 2 protein [Candidatus Wolfebacteria bacterium]|nr:glycosyltransferase family 2 protein [Candidatus Wolfebacteria bacterium]